jgi:hypothetical protein
MKILETKLAKIQETLDSTHSGYFVAFIFPTDKTMTSSDIVIKNSDTGKELKLTPTQVFGQSEEEVKNKIIEIIKQPFKKEDI